MVSSADELPSEGEEEAEISDEEEERGSSAEEEGSGEGSDDGESDEEGDSDEEEGSDASPSARRRRKKHKPFVAPPPRALPQRTTRGARMGKVAAEEGDEEFWNQEFFAEEANDERYETESEPEDRFDADFNETEDEEDEEQEAAEAEKDALAKEKKKKTLKPPGYKKPPLPRPRPAAMKQEDGGEASAGAGSAGAGGPARGAGAPRKRKSGSVGPEDYSVGRRTVRESTRLKVEEGELERRLAEKYKPRRSAPRSSNYRPLTQAELLAEAARTEIENTRSLEYMVMLEEETKKKAQVVKRRYAGPMVRWKSRRVGETEVSTLEVRNMAMPDELRHRVAPPPPPPALCAVTGQPARYRDPATGLPYATLDAFKELRRRRDAGLLAVPAAQAAVVANGAAVGLAGAGSPGQQQVAGTRYSTRQQAAAAPPPQFVQMAAPQPLYSPAALLQQQQPFGAAGAAQQQAAAAFLPLQPGAGGVT